MSVKMQHLEQQCFQWFTAVQRDIFQNCPKMSVLGSCVFQEHTDIFENVPKSSTIICTKPKSNGKTERDPMTNKNPSPATRFAPGNRLGGRPKGARERLGAKFLQALADDFDEHGEFVMQTVRKEDPTAYFTTVAKLLPREVEAKLQIEQRLPGNLDPQSWSTLRRVIDMIEHLAPAGVDPGEVFATVEEALHQAYAEPAPLAIEAPTATASPSRPIQLDLVDAVSALPPKPPF
jgi:hypothetical protein